MDQHNEKSPLPTGEKDDLQEASPFEHQYGYPNPTHDHRELFPNQQPQQVMSFHPYPSHESQQQGEGASLGSWQQQSYGTNPTAPPPPPIGSEETCSAFVYPPKSLVDTYLLAVVFGLIGVHHFYLKRYVWGIVYLLTFGLFGCGYIIDLFRVPYLVKKYNEEHSSDIALYLHSKKRKNLSDAYVAWFPCGLIGFHHYYLGNLAWGVAYTLTFGLFGIGWIVDGFRMSSLVRKANERILREENMVESEINIWVCYALGIPFGILGLHHFYLKRPLFGVFYFFTFGLLSFGWLLDLIRMPILLRRCNDEIKGTRDGHVKTVDDCYVLWLSFGLVGSHHFYLRRPLWGFAYFITFGLFGIGWLVDLFRIPSLVKDTNMKMPKRVDIADFYNSSQHIIVDNQNEAQYHTSGNIAHGINPTPHPYFYTPPIAGPPSYMDKPPPYQE